MEAEARCQMAEEERDVYRVLARRYQLRLEAALRRSGRSEEEANSDIEEDEEEAGEAMAPLGGRALSGREQAVIFGLGAMLRSMQYESGGEDDDDDDDDDIDEDDGNGEGGDIEAHQDNGRSSGEGMMDEDTSVQEQEGSIALMEEQGSEDNENEIENDGENRTSFFPLEAQGMAMPHSSALVVRPQRRTVSITSEDL